VLFAAEERDTVYSALSLMLENHISCVAVLTEQATPPPSLCGMLTLSDYLRRVALPRRDPDGVVCRDVMTPASEIAYVFAGNSVDSCLAIMAQARCHHLPVFTEDPGTRGELLGVVSMEELLGLTAEVRERSSGALSLAMDRLRPSDSLEPQDRLRPSGTKGPTSTV
jgi:CBS domain-containing protein